MDKAKLSHFVSLSSFYALFKRCVERAQGGVNRKSAGRSSVVANNEQIAVEMAKTGAAASDKPLTNMIKRLKGALDGVSVDNIELLDIDAINRLLLKRDNQHVYAKANDVFNTQTFLRRSSHWIRKPDRRDFQRPGVETFAEQTEVIVV